MNLSNESELMDVEEDIQKDEKPNKNETKLPFSIENLLADKFEKDRGNKRADFELGATSSSLDSMEYFRSDNIYNDNDLNDDNTLDSEDDDKVSTISEQVDVETSTSDAQEFTERQTDYQQTGKIT